MISEKSKAQQQESDEKELAKVHAWLMGGENIE